MPVALTKPVPLSCGCPPNPLKVYVGIFKVLVTFVAAPLEPVVVNVKPLETILYG